MDNNTESLDNFERIRKRANNCGYETSYGVIRDNNKSSNTIVIIGLIALSIGGYFYLKRKIKNLFEKPDLRPCGSNHDKNFDINPNKKSKNVIKTSNFDKSEAVDVDFIVKLNDKNHPEKPRYNCQFST